MSANLVTVDEESLRKDIMNLVRKPVNETLNGLLDEGSSELVGAGHHEGTAGLGYRVTVRFKLIALIYESIISSLSKSGIDAGSLRAPPSCGKVAILLGMAAFLLLRCRNDGEAFHVY